MSKYRVLDDNKNKYDGEVLTSIIIPETEMGFDIRCNSSNDINSRSATFTIDSYRLNPSGGLYEGNDIETSGNASIVSNTVRLFYGNLKYGEPTTINASLIFNNITNFNIRIANIIMSYQDDYWMVFDIEALNELSTADFIIDSHTSKTFNLTGTIKTTHSSVINWYIYFDKMNVYRVID